ncbi:MAG: Hypothetical protein C75L2_00080005 [Leptospirillum sp. Group II 'C75']|jgi:uncharacterized protein with von Willebrand factor type A (vWA) domain|uniref:Uncharacterized protein n=3 Tax=Leptospirillum ferriphilum TaxID=178606 RepID=A0A059Y1H1_9BACT|nr:hypothetical protein LFML04_0189 [Leptospirillum ferriphilum ML-04]AIA31401.1 hypothetical protein Y981_01065 [Leptospirillum ferriphilum YSK]AKS22623.1 hypothetical protein ABH19_00955 [Leptospirillum sp. Group II 'CF-1']EAY57856.1 MAG: hypothetical protein UBAL2_82410255 [Leptospirillum rubarum]EIJ75988.1 MAG: Hypothetical protein C75L2_00080005 [Leptospirillum sp. Group II 'C75']OOH69648.1 hypothetical protein BOX24_11515 [Leptospirillum ferriphilum]
MSLLRIPEKCPFFYIVEYSIKNFRASDGKDAFASSDGQRKRVLFFNRFLDGFWCENNVLLEEEVSFPRKTSQEREASLKF